MTHRLTFTNEELNALQQQLAPLKPCKFNPRTFILLRRIYGRIISLQLRDTWRKSTPEH